jgi:hypothetical protein
MPVLFKFAPVRHTLFRTISQAAVNYRRSNLSEGRAGSVCGGDRLPWVKVDLNGFADNFAPLASLDWQLHIYGEPDPKTQAACAARKLPLHIFPWRPEMGRAGLRRNAIYLLRPDGYVALVNPQGSVAAVTAYLDARKFILRNRVFSEHRSTKPTPKYFSAANKPR